jgi:hypothetical protein
MLQIGDIVYHSLYEQRFIVVRLYLQKIQYDREMYQEELMANCIALDVHNDIDYTMPQKHFILTGSWSASLYRVGVHATMKNLLLNLSGIGLQKERSLM